MAKVDYLFDILLSKNGSDLHLLEGRKPKIRVHGQLKELEAEPVLTRSQIKAYLSEICEPERWDQFMEYRDLDFAYAKDETSRFRANYYYQLHGMGAVFRIIPTKILTIEDLNLPPVIKTFANLRSGLVLVTGPTGSGKSTTLSAIIDYINTHYARYILTIEEPIEFVHPPKQSRFCQREVGADAQSFADALRSAGRQDCDVILVGEMRDYETISLALSAASMGTLVFGTLHTNSAIKTIDRIIDAFPSKQQAMARTMLADSLMGVCAQLLLIKKDGGGRVAANEILLRTRGLATNIRDGNTSAIHNIMQSSSEMGMQLMDDAIQHFLDEGVIDQREAYLKAHDKKRFEKRGDPSGDGEGAL